MHTEGQLPNVPPLGPDKHPSSAPFPKLPTIDFGADKLCVRPLA
jgi:hypothetical protein